MKSRRNVILYAALTLASVIFIALGNAVTSRGAELFTAQTASVAQTDVAAVREITDIKQTTNQISDTATFTVTEISYEAEVLLGERRGKRLSVTQTYDNMSALTPTPVRVGDIYFIYTYADGSVATGNLIRLTMLLPAFAVFVLLFILFARLKGASSLFALLMSVLSIFLVFVPAILSGRNVYLWALVICVYTVAITPFFVGGFNRKSLAAALGCLGGVAVAAALTALLNSLMRITGAADEEAMYVALILENPIDLRAVTFAAILIGALGAALDVSMSIASAVSEMKQSSPDAPASQLARSGMSVGRDIIGTQISTLVLAYIGGSLSVVLLLIAYQNSVFELLNLELVIIELLQSLVGAFTILFVIPATALVSARLLSGGAETKHGEKHRVHHERHEDGDAPAPNAAEGFHIGHTDK